MMSQFCVTENLEQLKKVWKKKAIFKKRLKSMTFLAISEIIWNLLKNRSCHEYFSEGVMKEIKTNKQNLKLMIDKKKL